MSIFPCSMSTKEPCSCVGYCASYVCTKYILLSGVVIITELNLKKKNEFEILINGLVFKAL